MASRYITKAQREELEDASCFGIEDAHELLEKYAGIEARPYTAYQYYDEDGNYLSSSDEANIDDLLEAAYVEVLDDGPAQT